MEAIRDTVGFRLRMAREARGLKQEDAGSELGLTGAAVARWEADNRQPTFANLKRLAKFYGVTVGWLMGESPLFVEESSDEDSA